MFEGFVQPLSWSRNRPPVTSDGYHMRSNGVFHAGVDLTYRRMDDESDQLPEGTAGYFTPNGTLALAAGPGVVTISSDIGTGGYVQISHDEGVITQYMHLAPRAIEVGAMVNAGDVVGTVGHNPLDYPFDHLHFELLIDGNKVDPQPYVESWPIPNLPLFAGMLSNKWIKYGLLFGAAYAAYELLG